ncbi:aminoglycoside phosphotransferase family protein [Longispora sp. K20-0274]|uniref:phosphotransferase family protein n=1 Tax=Longispora sp. K20-0274 TaxID=3088255 RepID=UPI00399A5E36
MVAKPEIEHGLSALATVLEGAISLRRWSPGTATNALELHPLPPDWTPPQAFAWLPVTELDTVCLPPGTVGRLRYASQRSWAQWMEDWAGRPGTPVHGSAAPWAQSDWYPQFTEWVSLSLAGRHIDPQGAAVPVQQWGISAVYRQRTSAGDFFAKAVRRGVAGRLGEPLFGHEPAITRALAEMSPRRLPHVFDADSAHGWLITADASITAIRHLPYDKWELGVLALAEVQKAWIGQEERLTSLGCADRRPGRLTRLLSSAPGRRPVICAELPPEAARREDLWAAIADLCGLLEAGPVPSTVTHGDFHAGNVGLRPDNSTCIIDWSYAALGHPFLDAWLYIHRLPEVWRTRVAETYLNEWRDAAPIAELHRMLDAAGVVSALHQVLTYGEIIDSLEPTEQSDFDPIRLRWWRRAVDSWNRYETRYCHETGRVLGPDLQ